MTHEDTPSERRNSLGRRSVLRTTAGALALPAGGTAAAERVRGRTTESPPEVDRSDPSSPADAAAAYVAALDAGDRAAANELIADDGPLDPWSRREFDWVGSFEIEYVGFRTVEDDGREVVGDVELTVAGNDGRVRYRFREAEDGGWRIRESIDGLRTEGEAGTGAADAAAAYVAALDAGNRAAANELIADGGPLVPWSRREFDWVGAFGFEFVGFRTVEDAGREVVGDVELRLAGSRRTVRYRFRETGGGGWEVWESIDGLRTEGEAGPEDAAAAYVAALDAGDRAAANELIADDGPLDPWSRREFDWVDAFDVRLVGFDAVRRRDASVTAELDVALAGTTERLTYELRRGDGGEWRLWRSPAGLR
jgi:hypothetical protein